MSMIDQFNKTAHFQLFTLCVCVRMRARARAREVERVWGWRSDRSQHCKMLLVDKRRRLQVSQNKSLTTTKTGKNLPLLFHRSSHTSLHCVGLYLFTRSMCPVRLYTFGCFSSQPQHQSLTIPVMPNTSLHRWIFCRGGHCLTSLPVWIIHWYFYLRNVILFSWTLLDDYHIPY